MGIDQDINARLHRLIHSAEIAMRQAKERKRDLSPEARIQVWDQSKDAASRKAAELANYLRAAAEKQDFDQQLELVYQPLVRLDETVDEFNLSNDVERIAAIRRRLVGGEALLRWHHPLVGAVSPGAFIPVAEQKGLIHSITEWVITQAAKQTRFWLNSGHHLSIACNISPWDLERHDFVDNIHRIVRRNSIPPKVLGLEVTEQQIADSLVKYRDALNELKELSICLIIDDFGVGYSNLSEIQRFKFDKLKLDRRFIPHTWDDHGRISICKAVSEMSKNLGILLVAEGIETMEQAEIMAQLGYHHGQGFYFGYPVTADIFTRYLPKK